MTSNLWQFSTGRVDPRLNRSRRRFLQFSAAALSSVALANCQRSPYGSSSESVSASTIPQSGASEPLYIYTWADYFNEDVYNRFTEQTGIQVVADVYDSNETMLTKLQAGGGSHYSILYPSDYMVKQMIELELLATVDQTRLIGLDQLLDKWQSPPYDPQNVHSIPVSWGTTGFIYDTTVVNSTLEDWDDLWQNQAQFSGKMTLLDDVREVMGAALKSLGYSYNSKNVKELEEAYQTLLKLKPAIAAFRSFGWEDPLIAGDLVLSMTYSIVGNALLADNPSLKYVIPKSGTSLWTDTLAIPKTAPNIEAAYAWINFLLEPENAAYAVEQLTFATPNKAAFELLSADLKENVTLYPTAEMLATCEGIASVGDTIDLYDQYWTQLRSA